MQPKVIDNPENIVKGVISSQTITNEYNLGVEEKEALTSRKIGNRLRAMKFEATTTFTSALGFFWNMNLFEKQLIKYGLAPLTSETSEKSEREVN